MKNIDVVVCGTFVADIIGRPIDLNKKVPLGSLTMIKEIKLFTGGLGCNLSIALAKLGMKVGLIGRIGSDSWKDLVFTTLKNEGIDFKNVIIDKDNFTAATIVCVDPSGERTFYHVGGAHMSVSAEDVLSKINYIKNSKVFALGYYGCMNSLEPDLPWVLREIKKKTKTKILLETAGFVKRTLDDLSKSLPYLDFFLPSLDEAKVLTGESDPKKIVKIFREAGAKNIVGLKMGEIGCYLTSDKDSFIIKAFKVKNVIDTTGAGDSFIAGFLTAELKGHSLYDIGRIANCVGASSIKYLGASTGIKNYNNYLAEINK